MYQFLVRDGDDEFKDANPTVIHLQKKLTKYFGGKVKMEKINTIRGTRRWSYQKKKFEPCC